jgi:hypothetical protein
MGLGGPIAALPSNDSPPPGLPEPLGNSDILTLGVTPIVSVLLAVLLTLGF